MSVETQTKFLSKLQNQLRFSCNIVALALAAAGLLAPPPASGQGAGVIVTVAGSGVRGFSGDGGKATTAALNTPVYVVVGSDHSVYLTDSFNHRVRKISPTGVITTVAGTGNAGYSGDGGPAAVAALNSPFAVALDSAGNLYIADTANWRIRKVDTAGIITTAAGNGIVGFSGDGGPATSASLDAPTRIAIDLQDNLYIADQNNMRIRKVDSATGTINTVAGSGPPGRFNGAYSGDGGPATNARFNHPTAVTVDAPGNIYVSDQLNHVVRKVGTNGIISTIAGTRVPGFSGDGGLAVNAALNDPAGLAVDAAGNLYVADNVNARVRKIDRNGIISTAVGNGNAGYSGDGGAATSASINNPFGVALDADGNLYVADVDNQRIRKVTLAAAPVTLSVQPQTLSFSGFTGGSTQRQALQIGTNSGTVSWTAAVTILNGAGWLVASPPSGTARANTPSRLILDVNFGALATGGIHQAAIVVRDTAGGATVRVPVTVVASPAGSRLLLSQSSFVFRTVEGGAPPAQTLRIVNGGQGSMNWTIPAPGTLSPPADWLGISNLSGTATAGRAGASTTTLSVSTAGLSAGVYQALVPVSAPGATNDLQLTSVTLHVVPAATGASGDVSAHGLVFVAGQGGAVPAAQSLRVSNNGGGSLSFQWLASTTSGGNWLSVTPTTGSTAAGPATVHVTANPAGLTAGIYRGKLTGTFTPGGTQEVEVVLAISTDPIAPQRGLVEAAVCAAATMEMVITSVGNGSALPVSFPRPLLATVVDSCGTGLSDATVVATVEGRAIPLASLGDGLYSGTWVPEQQAGSVPLSFVALHSTYPTVERTMTVSAAAAVGGTLPVLSPEGVVEGAGFTARRPLAPGGIVSLFGSRFAASDRASTQLPLSRDLAGVRVRIGGEDAPLYFAGAGQINAQVPYGVQTGNDVPVVVSISGQLTAPQTYQIAPAQPGIFLAGEGGAILDGQSRLVNAANPAQRGDVLQIFATGLGETDPPAQTGQGAPSFSRVLLPVTVTVGGVEAPVQYQGLAPGFVGLYQVNVVLPTTVTPGDNVEVVIRQNGISSNPERPAKIPVR